MLLTLETTHQPATDLGYLLHKNPARMQSADVFGGQAHVFYPVAEPERCQAAVLVDLDPVELVRGRRGTAQAQTLDQYVNDRPYVASSMMSVALAKLFGTAMTGRSKERPELAAQAIPLRVEISAIPCRGGESFLHELFEPLGYEVEAERLPLDESFPEWGTGNLFRLVLKTEQRLQRVLEHLYVLIPVLDNQKHYFVGPDEVEKLIARGSDWLPDHPAREAITRRYLRFQGRLTRDALGRLSESGEDQDRADANADAAEEAVERPLSLNEQRLRTFVQILEQSGARSVADLGCGEGKLLKRLLERKQFERIVGLDVSVHALERAARRMYWESMPERQRARIELLQGSLLYCDPRLRDYDAAVLMEVIEHVEPDRVEALTRTLFEFAQPRMVLVSTPNAEFNQTFENLTAVTLRHHDHRFEWNRAEFTQWADQVCTRFGYRVKFLPIGEEHPEYGPPTQLAVFER